MPSENIIKIVESENDVNAKIEMKSILQLAVAKLELMGKN